MKILVGFALVVTYLTLSMIAVSQDTKKLPQLNEMQKNQMYEIQHRIDVHNRQIVALDSEFVKLQARAKEIQADYANTQAQLEADLREVTGRQETILKSMNFDPSKYAIDTEKMVVIEKPPAEKKQ